MKIRQAYRTMHGLLKCFGKVAPDVVSQRLRSGVVIEDVCLVVTYLTIATENASKSAGAHGKVIVSLQ